MTSFDFNRKGELCIYLDFAENMPTDMVVILSRHLVVNFFLGLADKPTTGEYLPHDR